MTKVAILGGGVAGMSAAHELLERGYQVEVYDLGDLPGGKAKSMYHGPPGPNNRRLPAEHGVEDFTAEMAMAVSSARISAARSIDIEDVEEAAAAIDPKAVEAWVAERQERFRLDADVLTRLADTGLPASVTDVMVAVS